MSWHYIGTTWMSTKCQHCWNCVPLTPVTLWWHFPLATNVSKRFIGRDCFHMHCCCREQPFCALWRHRSGSTCFHIDVLRVFQIDFQARLKIFWSNGNVYLWHLTIYCVCIVIISLHLYQMLTFSRMSTPQCHEINVMTFDAECHEICFVGRKTNVMTLMSWYLENVMRFIFSGTGARSWNNDMHYMSFYILIEEFVAAAD